jgi:hypothetical protein
MRTVEAMEVDAPEAGGKLSAAQKGKGKFLPTVKGGPWVEKYRPANLSDVAAHKDIIDTSNVLLCLYSVCEL